MTYRPLPSSVMPTALAAAVLGLVAMGCNSTSAAGPSASSGHASGASTATSGAGPAATGASGSPAASSGNASSTSALSAVATSSGAGTVGSNGTAGGSAAATNGSSSAGMGSSGAAGSAAGSSGSTGLTPCTTSATCPPGDSCSNSGYCLPTGDCVSMNDCDVGEFCDAGTCQPGGRCGGSQIAAAPVPPNLLFTLDRSCSMTQVPSGGAATDAGGSKWDLAVQAIDDMMVGFDGGARFGLTVFPERDAGDDNSCAVTAEAVPAGPGTESTISALLDAALVHGNADYPDGPCVTPIDSGLYGSSLDPALADATRSSFLILITDGEQTACNVHGGATGGVNIIAALKAQTPSVGTFVIGFGSEVNHKQLNKYAVAGGEEVDAGGVDGGDRYYQVGDLASLQGALADIAHQTVGCVLSLQSVPPDPSLLYVFLQEGSTYVPIAEDGGWTYDSAANELILLDQVCAEAQQTGVAAVDVEYGCVN